MLNIHTGYLDHPPRLRGPRQSSPNSDVKRKTEKIKSNQESNKGEVNNEESAEGSGDTVNSKKQPEKDTEPVDKGTFRRIVDEERNLARRISGISGFDKGTGQQNSAAIIWDETFGTKTKFFTGENADGLTNPEPPYTVYINSEAKHGVAFVYGHKLLHHRITPAHTGTTVK